ncbi:hypothetical protein NQZ68_001075 [Dissostichus eleginoides]|nr:hypothetical protein NQZ68_001075 [Dissostichus eleginoides]
MRLRSPPLFSYNLTRRENNDSNTERIKSWIIFSSENARPFLKTARSRHRVDLRAKRFTN